MASNPSSQPYYRPRPLIQSTPSPPISPPSDAPPTPLPCARSEFDQTIRAPPVALTRFTCDTCNAFTTCRKSDLTRHKKTHSTAKPYVCQLPGCTYATRQNSNLQTHMRTHTGEKPKACERPGCTFKTHDPALLTRHMKKKHNYIPTRSGGPKYPNSAAKPLLSPTAPPAPARPTTTRILTASSFVPEPHAWFKPTLVPAEFSDDESDCSSVSARSP